MKHTNKVTPITPLAPLIALSPLERKLILTRMIAIREGERALGEIKELVAVVLARSSADLSVDYDLAPDGSALIPVAPKPDPQSTVDSSTVPPRSALQSL